MSDQDANSQGLPLTHGGIADLFLNNPLAPPTADDQVDSTTKTWLDEPVTNEQAHNDDTNAQNYGSSFLDVPPADTTEDAAKQDPPVDENFNEEIQKDMAKVINDMQSSSPSAEDAQLSREPNASRHSPIDEGHHSEPILTDQATSLEPVPSSTDEVPLRSASEPLLTDHATDSEPTPILPVRKDESSSDIDDNLGIPPAATTNTAQNDDPFEGINDQPQEKEATDTTTNDDFFDTKPAVVDDDQRSFSPAKSNVLDETTRFTTTSSKSSTSRAPSATSKRSVRATPDDLSTTADEKPATKSPDDAGTETDRENQEVSDIARRPSVARSPVDRPRSPTPDDSARAMAKTGSSPVPATQDQPRIPSPTVVDQQPEPTEDIPRMSPVINQSKSPSPVLMERRSPTEEQPVATSQPASRRESAAMVDQKPSSRALTPSKSKPESNTVSPAGSRRASDHLPETSQPPATDHTAETRSVTSPPLSPKVEAIVATNPLLDDQSRRSSVAKRQSPTPSQGSPRKDAEAEPAPVASRRESQVHAADVKTPSPPASPAADRPMETGGSRRSSQAKESAEPDTPHEPPVPAPASRRSSKLSQGPADDGHAPVVEAEQPSPKATDEAPAREHPGHSRQGSTASVKEVRSKRSSIASEKATPSVHDEPAEEPKVATSKRGSTASLQKVPSRRESTHEPVLVSSKRSSPVHDVSTESLRKSVADKPKTPSPPPNAVHDEARQASRRSSAAMDPQRVSRSGSFVEDQKPASRRQSTQETVPASKRVSTASEHLGFSPNAPEEQPASRRESTHEVAQLASKRTSTVSEHKPASRRDSTHEEPAVASKRGSIASDHPIVHQHDETNDESKGPSRRESTMDRSFVSSKRPSAVMDQTPASRRDTVVDEHAGTSRQSSAKDEQKIPGSKRESTVLMSNGGSRRGSEIENQHHASQRHSFAPESHPPSKRHSTASEHSHTNGERSTAPIRKESSRVGSAASDPVVSGSKRASITADEDQAPENGQENHRLEKPMILYQQSSIDGQEQKPTSKPPSRKSSFTDRPGVASRRESEHQPVASRRESEHQPIPSRRESEYQPARSRRESEHQPIPSRRESEYQPVASRRASDYDDHRSPSPHHLTVVDHVPSKASSRRSSNTKVQDETLKGSSRAHSSSVRDEQVPNQSRPISGHVSNGLLINHRDTRGTSESSTKEGQSSDLDTPHQRLAKTNHTRTPSQGQISQSPSTDHDRVRRVSSHKRSSGQHSKRSSQISTEETVVVPISLESSNPRIQTHRSTSDSDVDAGSSRLPPVNGLTHTMEPAPKHPLPKSYYRKDYKPVSASPVSTPAHSAKHGHWIEEVPIPTLNLSDNELSRSYTDQARPKSPNVEQIAERNQPPTPLIASTAKTRDSADIHKKKGGKRVVARMVSADESAHIRLVDDESLDSASEHNVEIERHKGRRLKPKLREAGTNTDEYYEPYAHRNLAGMHQEQRYYYDNGEYSSPKPLKATKPMPEHLHNVRRRIASQDQPASTPETARDAETPGVHRVVKQSKDSAQSKDPVNVNVTVVVKKFGGSGRERSSNTTTEYYVEERSTPSPRITRRPLAAGLHRPPAAASTERESEPVQERTHETLEEQSAVVTEERPTTVEEQPVETEEQPADTEAPPVATEEEEKYFEHVPLPPAPEEVVHEDEDEKVEESIIRPSSTDHAYSATSKKTIHFEDRATQSDGEQMKTEPPKRRLRPKRISRTCQTYEHIFRRMEREQQQELRAVADTDKNVQTRKSQLRPRKKSPRKDHSVYLSNDSFRVEDLLPSHFHQSRRHVSKSSVVARSLSPQGGKLLILRPTLPFHHTDAVNVHRVCLQYAIDLIPSENAASGSPPTHRIKSSVQQQSDSFNSLPMIRSASPVTTTASAKSRKKDKSASHKSEDHDHHHHNHHHHHHRKHSGAH